MFILVLETKSQRFEWYIMPYWMVFLSKNKIFSKNFFAYIRFGEAGSVLQHSSVEVTGLACEDYSETEDKTENILEPFA